MSALASRLDSDGYALLPGAWPQAACVSACLALDAAPLCPLLLHALSKARGHSRRHVLHCLFGPPSLPGGLCWPDWAAAAQPA